MTSEPRSLVMTAIQNVPFIKKGNDLAAILIDLIKKQGLEVNDNDIFVFAQKIVSKAEGRLVNLDTIQPSDEAYQIEKITQKDPRFIEAVLRESKKVIRTRPNTLIVEHKNGFICANAGIDHSNVGDGNPLSEDWVLLLPEDADKSAAQIRKKLEVHFSKKIGVLIIDSHGRAWRNGTVGITIGVAGIPALVDLRGKKDLVGFELRITMVGAADELAAGASLMMGQASEGTPIIHVKGFPYPLRESSLQELIRPEETDLFR